MSSCYNSNIDVLILSSPMELRILFFKNRSEELDASTEAADIDVSRRSCKTFMTIGNICTHHDGWCNVSAMVPGFSLLHVQCVFHTLASCSNEVFVESKSVPNRSYIELMVWIARCSTCAGIMFTAKTASEAKVVNLELNSRKKRSKNRMKIDLLKCSLVVDAGTLFRVVFYNVF